MGFANVPVGDPIWGMAMQVMSNRVMGAARGCHRLAGGDLGIVKQAMADARRDNAAAARHDGAPYPRPVQTLRPDWRLARHVSEQHPFLQRGHDGVWGTLRARAAPVSVSRTAPLPVTATPSMTCGNRAWLLPPRRACAAGRTSMKIISVVVACDDAALVRTVGWRTVAKTLSIGMPVRR